MSEGRAIAYLETIGDHADEELHGAPRYVYTSFWGGQFVVPEDIEFRVIHFYADAKDGVREVADEFALFEQWTVHVDDPRHPPARLTFVLDDELRPQCVELTLVVGHAGPIRSEDLRRVPIATIGQETLALAAVDDDAVRERQRESLELHRDGFPAQAADVEPYRDAFYETWRANRPRPRGAPITDEFLAEIADIYRAALERGDPPTQTIAQLKHASRSTVSGWIRKARDEGHLGEAIPGKAGEQTPPDEAEEADDGS